MWAPEEASRGHWIPGAGGLCWLNSLTWGLGTEVQSSGRVANAPTHWAISPVLKGLSKAYFTNHFVLFQQYYKFSGASSVIHSFPSRYGHPVPNHKPNPSSLAVPWLCVTLLRSLSCSFSHNLGNHADLPSSAWNHFLWDSDVSGNVLLPLVGIKNIIFKFYTKTIGGRERNPSEILGR